MLFLSISMAEFGLLNTHFSEIVPMRNLRFKFLYTRRFNKNLIEKNAAVFYSSTISRGKCFDGLPVFVRFTIPSHPFSFCSLTVFVSYTHSNSITHLSWLRTVHFPLHIPFDVSNGCHTIIAFVFT